MHAGTNYLNYPPSQCHFCLGEYYPTALEQKYCSRGCKRAKYHERMYGHESAKRFYLYEQGKSQRRASYNEQQGRYCLHCSNC